MMVTMNVIRFSFWSWRSHSWSRSVRLWGAEGEPLATIKHSSCVTAAVFSPTGDQVLAASEDWNARIWDLEGNQLTLFRGHLRSIKSLAYSPSGNLILTGSDDKTARLWLVDVFAVAEKLAIRDFTPDERARYVDLLEATHEPTDSSHSSGNK